MGSTEDLASRRLATRPRPLLERVRYAVVHYVLGVNDTPHHIALGVFLGFVVGMTPTLGLQLVIYVALATLTRANKISGILPVFVTNPLTAVPIYYFNWWLGNLLTGGSDETRAFARRAIERVMTWDRPWLELLAKAVAPGVLGRLWRIIVELWVGSLAIGFALGFLFYFVTIEAVVLYRKKARPKAE